MLGLLSLLVLAQPVTSATLVVQRPVSVILSVGANQELRFDGRASILWSKSAWELGIYGERATNDENCDLTTEINIDSQPTLGEYDRYTNTHCTGFDVIGGLRAGRIQPLGRRAALHFGLAPGYYSRVGHGRVHYESQSEITDYLETSYSHESYDFPYRRWEKGVLARGYVGVDFPVPPSFSAGIDIMGGYALPLYTGFNASGRRWVPAGRYLYDPLFLDILLAVSYRVPLP